MAFGSAFVDARILQNPGEYPAGFLEEDLQGVVRGKGMASLQLRDPIGVLGKGRIAANVPALEDGLGQIGQLTLQAAGEHRQAHDLDEADVLLLDVVLVDFLTRCIAAVGAANSRPKTFKFLSAWKHFR